MKPPLQEPGHHRLCLHRRFWQRQAAHSQRVRIPDRPPGDGRLLQLHQHHRGAAPDGGEPAEYRQEGVRDLCGDGCGAEIN